MTQCCFQTPNSITKATTKKKNSKLSDFATACSLVLSHPLYLSYLIFFSPYLFKLLSFLTPLFITTFLLVFSLLTTVIPLHSVLNSQEGFFLTAYNTLLEKLRPRFDDEGENLQSIEQLEVYKIVFDTTPVIEVMESERFEETPVGFSEESEETEDHQCESVIMGPETGDSAKPNKVMDEVKKFESFLIRSGSEANKVPPINEGVKPKGVSLRVDDEKKLSEAFSQTVGSPPYLGSFGSMRKEREWRRTLACKLFEERHNWSINGVNGGVNGGEEGMDMLWETHETEQDRGKLKEKNIKKGRSKREKIEDLMMMVNEDEDEDEDNYGGGEEEDDHNGKFCCLQALKLSAGKMNLNMGRPNLIKIGKAFKGMGWLQSPVRRQGKKGYK